MDYKYEWKHARTSPVAPDASMYVHKRQIGMFDVIILLTQMQIRERISSRRCDQSQLNRSSGQHTRVDNRRYMGLANFELLLVSVTGWPCLFSAT